MLRSLALTLLAAPLAVSVAQQPGDEPGFEVASVKPSDPNPDNPMFIGMSADGAMVKYTNITLRDCIRAAYRVREFQIVGPDWIGKARFEISAKLPAGASADQIPDMLKALLSERFRLEIRREMKEQNVYALLVGNGGPKLKPAEMKPNNRPSALGPDGKPRDTMMFRFLPGAATITAPSASVASLAWLMSRFTARPVVDMTGIEGQYDFNLTFAPETGPDMPHNPAAGPDAVPAAEPAPSLFDAVKQYGLRLEARKAPLEMLVVTHVEKTPTEN